MNWPFRDGHSEKVPVEVPALGRFGARMFQTDGTKSAKALRQRRAVCLRDRQ